MTASIPTTTLLKFTTFGDMLRFLRRRCGITQMELAIAVGYSDAQISRLEQNLRLPDIPTIEARFIPALDLEDDPKATARLLELAADIRREDSPTLGLCPYKGLNYFDENDADLFVGRESLTSTLVERLLSIASGAEPDRPRILTVVGASGSGKSSLVRAGMIPVLRWNRQTANWQIHTLTPTARPLESLAAELTQPSSVAVAASLIDDLGREPRSLHLRAKQLTKAASASRLLLVVDQFEELFALCHSEAERASFIDNLITAASEAGGPTIVILTLRADFYAHCAVYPRLREALAQRQEYIGSMNSDELRRVIEEPARRGRWEFEPGLVDLLLHDVGVEPGALPLLSHALLETWERRRGHIMTLSGYTSSGGVRGAIAETAEAVFTDQFTTQQQGIARRIFLRLTELGDENSAGDTRRRAAFDELSLKADEAAPTQFVLRALADARLVTLSGDAAEVAHEALIREWPRLRGWLQDNREGLRLHRQLSDAALDWARLHREEGALYRGARLAQAREWAVANADEMNALEHEFLAASIEAAEREAAESERRRQRELQAAQELAKAENARAEEQTRSANRLRVRNRVISAVGSVGLILAILAASFGAQARNNLRVAQASFARAESLRLAAEANVVLAQHGDPQIATLLSIRALRSNYSPQADAALSASLAGLYNRQILRGHTGSIYSVCFSPDGRYALTGSQDGTARLWDLSNAKQVRLFAGHKGGVAAVAFSPNGKFILTGGNDQTVRLWETGTGQQLRMFSGHTGAITAVAFSPDGQEVLSASGDKTARLWDVRTGLQIQAFNGHSDLVSDAAYSPDGQYVLTGSYDNTARLWNAATGQAVRTFASADVGFANRHVTSVAFSPDGKYVVTGSDDRTAKLWEIDSGQPGCTFTGHTDSVNDVAFSPDGKYVLTGSEDKTARVWQTQTCEEVRRYGGLEAGAKSVAFSPDGQTVLTGSEDNTARLWSAPASAPLRTFDYAEQGIKILTYTRLVGSEVGPPGITGVTFSPDGKYILTGSQDSTARLWYAATGKEIRAFIGHTKAISGLTFSPDGKYVLTGSDDHTARLWDAETGRQLRTVVPSIVGVTGVAFSPNGRYFLTTTSAPSMAEPQTSVWDTSTGQLIRTLHVSPGSFGGTSSTTVAFSPDGRIVLVQDLETGADLLDFGTGQKVCKFVGHLDFIDSVAYSPDGKYVVTGSNDKTARLWDAKTCGQVRVFTDQASSVTSVAFSPDGRYILTGHDDSKARLWDVATGQLLRTFTGHSSWVRSVAFSPDGRYVLTGSQDGTARLWDTDYHDTIRFACSLLWRDFTGQERTQYSIADVNPTCR